MSDIYSFLELFYSTFGVTPPKHGKEQQALLWLLAVVGGSISFVGLMLFAIYSVFVR